MILNVLIRIVQHLYALVVLWPFYLIKNFIYYHLIPLKYKAKSIDGQHVLITGAGHGLGKLMAIKLSKMGAVMILVDINAKANSETMKEIIDAGGVAHAFTCDVSKRDEVYKVCKQIKDTVGDVDILINNAGILIGKNFMSLSENEIDKLMQINVMAHFWTIKSFLPAMLAKNKGHIVQIASSAGFNGVNKLTDYCTSKHCAVGLTEALTSELKRFNKNGVKTTLVCPYYVNTGMCDGVTPGMPVLDADYVTDKIVEGILIEKTYCLIPETITLMMIMKQLLPTQVYSYILDDILLTNQSMDTFTGNPRKDPNF